MNTINQRSHLKNAVRGVAEMGQRFNEEGLVCRIGVSPFRQYKLPTPVDSLWIRDNSDNGVCALGLIIIR